MKSRQIIKEIFSAALNSALPRNLIRKGIQLKDDTLYIHNRTYRLSRKRGVYVFGSGKAAIQAAGALEDIIKNNIAGGFVVSNYDDRSLRNIQVFVSAHPVPDERSLHAADLLMERLAGLSEEDFFIYVLSGGSSSLVEKPMPPLTLRDLQELSRILLRKGMAVDEMNAVRKHLSLVKGGKLGEMIKAKGIVLVISDVIGDELDTIGSGLLYCDKTSYLDTYNLLGQHGLWDSLPFACKQIMEKGLSGEIDDTPKNPNPNIEHLIIGSNMAALIAAKERAESLGLKCFIMTSRLRGEAREVAKAVVSLGEEIAMTNNPFSHPVCLLFGGETTVTVRGKGRGGRNQEMCLAAVKEIKNRRSILFLSAGTDGVDGNSKAAGAFVDHHTYEEIRRLGLCVDDCLNNNDSNSLLEKTGSLLVTGPTGTNVMDIMILLIAGVDL